MPAARVATGISGLDYALGGGLPGGRLYLLQGDPGAGKTTMALQFLLEGRRLGERTLFVSLGETAAELEATAASHGWSLDGIEVHELGDLSSGFGTEYTMFHPSEVEFGETSRRIMEAVDRIQPARVAFDSLSEMRLLASDPLRYRRQIMAFKQAFATKACTVMLLDDCTGEEDDRQLRSIVHGVVTLEHLAPGYGGERRRMRIVKLRGAEFRGGFHDFTIGHGGVTVFPRVVAADHGSDDTNELVPSGIAELDALCGGGLDRASSALLVGPAGTGKSTLATQFVVSAANRGERGAIFAFDESVATLLARSRAVGMPLANHVAAGRIAVRQIDPAEVSPGEFGSIIQSEVAAGASVILIDSLNGYLNAMPDERFLVAQMHELLTYAAHHRVLTMMTVTQQGIIGGQMSSPVDLSYLADTALLLRYFEIQGEIRKALSVIKRRRGAHEATIREFVVSGNGLRLGPPLREFRGVLTGVPAFEGKVASLVATRTDGARGD